MARAALSGLAFKLEPVETESAPVSSEGQGSASRVGLESLRLPSARNERLQVNSPWAFFFAQEH